MVHLFLLFFHCTSAMHCFVYTVQDILDRFLEFYQYRGKYCDVFITGWLRKRVYIILYVGGDFFYCCLLWFVWNCSTPIGPEIREHVVLVLKWWIHSLLPNGLSDMKICCFSLFNVILNTCILVLDCWSGKTSNLKMSPCTLNNCEGQL